MTTCLQRGWAAKAQGDPPSNPGRAERGAGNDVSFAENRYPLLLSFLLCTFIFSKHGSLESGDEVEDALLGAIARAGNHPPEGWISWSVTGAVTDSPSWVVAWVQWAKLEFCHSTWHVGGALLGCGDLGGESKSLTYWSRVICWPHLPSFSPEAPCLSRRWAEAHSL